MKKKSLRTQMLLLNTSITLAALLLCGIVFVVSVWLIMEKNIRHDLEFFMTETNDNLNTKTEYLEQIIYKVRESEPLMDYLEKSSIEESFMVQTLFEKVVTIGNQKNNAGGSLPIVEKIYLFDKNDVFFHAFYYAMITLDVEKSDLKMQDIYHQFKESQRENGSNYRYFVEEDESLYLAYTLYNGNMEDVGTCLFELKISTLQKIMTDIHNYQESFWTLYDQSGLRITGIGNEGQGSVEHLQEVWEYAPYEDSIGNESYLLSTQELCMNLNSTIGIPRNQTTILLYDSTRIYLTWIVVIMVAAALGFIFIIYHMTKPLQEITDKLAMVQQGNFTTKLPSYNSREFHEISLVFNEMTTYVNHLIKQVYEKQLSVKEMELKFLQTQMNPHFMFNVLNTIALQAKMEQNETIFKMITSFSQLIQAKIYREDKEKVKVRQELEYVEYYLYLQNNRYGDRLQYNIKIEDKSILEMEIPKLCIQLIVENAVVHGIEPQTGNGFVEVRIYREENIVCIDTTDNGIGFEEDGEINLPIKNTRDTSEHNQVGLNNVHHIIQLMYGEAYGIRVFSEKNKGTKVSIRIPFDLDDHIEEV